MRETRYNASSKTIVASQTMTFTPQDLGGPGMVGKAIVAFVFAMTGAGGTLANLSRIRVKLGGKSWWEATGAQLRAYLESMTRNNNSYATTDTRFLIPFYDLRQINPDLADRWQLPNGLDPSVEIVFGATDLGTCTVGVQRTDQPAEFWPQLITRVAGIGASAPTGRLNLQEPGIVRALVIPDGSGDLSALRVVLEGREILNASEQILVGVIETGGAQTLLDPLVFPLFDNDNLTGTGEAYLELNTGASFTTSDEVAIFTLNPARRAA